MMLDPTVRHRVELVVGTGCRCQTCVDLRALLAEIDRLTRECAYLDEEWLEYSLEVEREYSDNLEAERDRHAAELAALKGGRG